MQSGWNCARQWAGTVQGGGDDLIANAAQIARFMAGGSHLIALLLDQITREPTLMGNDEERPTWANWFGLCGHGHRVFPPSPPFPPIFRLALWAGSATEVQKGSDHTPSVTCECCAWGVCVLHTNAAPGAGTSLRAEVGRT